MSTTTEQKKTGFRAISKWRKGRYYEPIIKKAKYWPVVQLSKDKKSFIEEVTEATLQHIQRHKPSKSDQIEIIETALYRERLRMRANPWRVDPKDEKKFWTETKNQLVELNGSSTQEEVDELLKRIISRYSNEVAGDFKPSRYKVARSVVKFGFRRLLNAARVKGMFGIFKSDYYLTDKIQIYGKIKQLRKLAKEGTIVMVPTHFSNLDSILIGWIIHVLGLPPFIYGAGLNLFNIKIIAYFMNSLGAYKVDRRKKNFLYIETLKMYSQLAIKKGAHSLFFPGGTRSRSGHIEKKLKRGLLGTAVEAQRAILLDKSENPNGIPTSEKIFIVPVVINYNFVLEAPTLVNDYLKKTGQERFYQEADEFSTSYKISKFLVKFFTKGSNISVSIGKPMDVLGNYVNSEGQSLDRHKRHIKISDYFKVNGKVTENPQREEEYTRMLSLRIVEEFHKINRIFASHLVAYVAFKYWRQQYSQMDLYSFLRLPVDELEIDYYEFRDMFSEHRDKLFELKKQKKIKIAGHLKEGEIDDIIKNGLNNVGLYHSKRPLVRKRDKIITEDLATLFYYYNRTDGYDL